MSNILCSFQKVWKIALLISVHCNAIDTNVLQKVAFIRKVRCVFHIYKKWIGIPNRYPELEFLLSVLLLLAGNFKYRILIWIFFVFEKHIALSEKKPPLEIDLRSCLRLSCQVWVDVRNNSDNVGVILFFLWYFHNCFWDEPKIQLLPFTGYVVAKCNFDHK